MNTKIVRQAKFNPDGSITDVPARNSEQPQLERQPSLLDWAKYKELLAGLGIKSKGG